jgi:hypothetical protein
MENKIDKAENKKKTWSKPKLYTPLEINKTYGIPEGVTDDEALGYSS